MRVTKKMSLVCDFCHAESDLLICEPGLGEEGQKTFGKSHNDSPSEMCLGCYMDRSSAFNATEERVDVCKDCSSDDFVTIVIRKCKTCERIYITKVT